jgi:hypothetical protein
MNGRDLRNAINKEFEEVWEYDHITFNVRTKHGRSYELPKLEVYITHTPNYLVYEQLAEFVLDWFRKHKHELKVKAPREYYVANGMKFPKSQMPDVSITDIEVVLGAFAL